MKTSGRRGRPCPRHANSNLRIRKVRLVPGTAEYLAARGPRPQFAVVVRDVVLISEYQSVISIAPGLVCVPGAWVWTIRWVAILSCFLSQAFILSWRDWGLLPPKNSTCISAQW